MFWKYIHLSVMIPLNIVTIHVPCINKRVSAHNTLPTLTIKDMWTQIIMRFQFLYCCVLLHLLVNQLPSSLYSDQNPLIGVTTISSNGLSSQQKHKWSLYGDQPQENGVGTQRSADCICLHHQVYDAWQPLTYVSTSLLWQTNYNTLNIFPSLSRLNTQQTSLTTATVKSLDSKDLIHVHTRPHLLQV
jgi:hypothetical protein